MSNKSRGAGYNPPDGRLTRCERCHRRLRSPKGDAADEWGLTLLTPIGPQSTICPDCLTPAEHLEKEVNGAMLKPLGIGRLVPRE